MPEWYHKNYGHLAALHVANLAKSFHHHHYPHTAPEGKV